MPRMSKKRKEEWAFFLNERNRIAYNPLCRRCRRSGLCLSDGGLCRNKL